MVIRAIVLINGGKVHVRSEVQSNRLPMTIATIKQATEALSQHLHYLRAEQRKLEDPDYATT